MSKPKLPKGWKTVTLGNILSQEQIVQTMQILQRPVSDEAKTKMLKEYYGQFRDELSAKGYDADFLAYAIPYWIGKSAEEEAERERRGAEDITNDFLRDRQN